MKGRSPQRKKADIGALRQLGVFVAPYRWRLLLGAVALAVTTLAMVAIPQHVRVMVDVALKNGDLLALNKAVFWLIATVAALVAGIFLRTIAIRFTSMKIAADLRKKAFAHVLSQEVAFFESQRTGEIISRLVADISKLAEILNLQIPQLARGTLLLIGSLVMLFYTNTKLTLILLSVAPVIIGLAIFLGRRWRKDSAEVQAATAALSGRVEEAVGNVRTVRVFGQEEREAEAFNHDVDGMLAVQWRYVRSVAAFFCFNVFAGFGALALVMWVGGRDVLAGTFTIGEMMAFFLYIAFLGDAFSGISGFWPSLQTAAGATERLFDILRRQPALTAPEHPELLPKAAGGRAVVFEAVSFAYPARKNDKALNQVSLSVPAGKTVAVVGHSGAGKSTLFSLLLRLYDPQEGRVLLDSVDLKTLSFESLRENVGVVAQEAPVFSGSVLENIRYGRPEASEKEVEAAARAAFAHPFISELPSGYHTQVGERGVRLSGGQKQRIAIARAILKNPPVLLLDEATSHLDAHAERELRQAFRKLAENRTTLVIAHRLATVKDAASIVVLDRGKVVAQGRHATLMRDCSLYRELAELQFLSTG